MTVLAWRKPTADDIRYGHGCTHYCDFPLDRWLRKDGTVKAWIVDGGLRWYR